MVRILKPNRTTQSGVRFCSAFLSKKGLMRNLMHIVRCGYPPDNIGAVAKRISMQEACRVHRGYQTINGGYRAPNIAIWHQVTFKAVPFSAYSHKALSN